MNPAAKRAAIAAYTERKQSAGVYAIRCAASGQVWVGGAPNIDTIQNRIWFSLRQRGTTMPQVQAAWDAHGEAGLTFEVLQRIDEEAAYVRRSLLKERTDYWREQLDAGAV